MKDVFSDYFKPTDRLYIDDFSHKSGIFSKKDCLLIAMNYLQNSDIYMNKKIFLYRETHIWIQINTETYIHSISNLYNLFLWLSFK